MGNKQIKKQDQLTDSDAVCPSQFGANDKQNQEENQITEGSISQFWTTSRRIWSTDLQFMLEECDWCKTKNS